MAGDGLGLAGGAGFEGAPQGGAVADGEDGIEPGAEFADLAAPRGGGEDVGEEGGEFGIGEEVGLGHPRMI